MPMRLAIMMINVNEKILKLNQTNTITNSHWAGKSRFD